MHYTLKVQTTDAFQKSSMSHNAGVKNESINLEVKGLNVAKKVQKTALASIYLYQR